MQSYVPVDLVYRRTEIQRKTDPQPSTCQIAYNDTCQTCSEEGRNLRQLPCQHEFCKQCLKSHIEAYDEQKSGFSCPVCRASVKVPKGAPKEKLMQSFKGASRSVFYDTEADAMFRAVSFNDSNFNNNLTLDEAKDVLTKDVVIRNTGRLKGQSASTRRTALRITGSLLGQIQGFRVKRHDDLSNCMCWGVDCFPNGDMVVADWGNSSIKLHSKDGIFMSKLKMVHKPLGICVLDSCHILVSLGSRHKLIYLLKVVNGELHNDRIFTLKGYLYDIGRYKDKCIGVCQIDDNVIELLRVTRDGKANIKCIDIDKGVISLLSHSGICFKSKPTPRIYFSSGDTLVCLDTNGSMTYKRTYTFTEGDATKTYSLGAVCLDSRDGLFIAADYCVLHVDKNCDLVNVMPTKIDPFAITAQPDGVTLVIVGRNKTAETYRVNYGIQ